MRGRSIARAEAGGGGDLGARACRFPPRVAWSVRGGRGGFLPRDCGRALWKRRSSQLRETGTARGTSLTWIGVNALTRMKAIARARSGLRRRVCRSTGGRSRGSARSGSVRLSTSSRAASGRAARRPRSLIRAEVRATPDRLGLQVSHKRLSSSPPITATCSGTSRPIARQA